MSTKNPLKDSPTTIGNRIKSARMLCGHNRRSFATLSGISLATLRVWEEPTPDRTGLTSKGAKRLAQAFNEFGIFCTEEWLLYEIGPSPSIIKAKSNDANTELENSWGDEEAILRDVDAFKKHNSNAIVTMLTDESMLPLFAYGDYVGGSQVTGEKIKDLIGLNCIIEIGGRILVKRINDVKDDRYTLISLNHDPSITNTVLTDVILQSAAEIVWHRWRKKSKTYGK